MLFNSNFLSLQYVSNKKLYNTQKIVNKLTFVWVYQHTFQ